MLFINQGIRTLIQAGLSEIILFILVFVVTFATIRSINLFGISKPKEGEDESEWKKSMKKNRNIHTIISLATGILSILPHHVGGYEKYDIVRMIERVIPQFSFVVLGIFCALILLGFFGLKLGAGSDGNPLKTGVFVLSVGFIVFIFGSNMNYWKNPWRNFLTPDIVAVIIAVLVFAIIVSFIMGGDETKYKTNKEFFEKLKNGDLDWKKAKGSQKFLDFIKNNK